MSSPFRLGFLTHLRGSTNPQKTYQETLDLFVAADQLGFDTGWVAQHHFKDRDGYLPSPFPFLAAVAERTKRIRLGTSIVVLPLEMPLRVAEDAAVVDLLSSGRLELGVGSGSDPKEFAAFGVDIARRHELNTIGLKALKSAFRGEKLGDSDQTLQPPAPGLGQRMWLSALSERGAQYAAQNEMGLLLSRAVWTSAERTDKMQLPVAQAYLEAWENQDWPARIGLSRGVYVAEDKQAALDQMGPDIMGAIETMIKQGRMSKGLSLEDYCRRMYIAYGHPDEVAAHFAADQVLSHAADLILQFDPVHPPLGRAIAMLEQIATQVAPTLGWQPSN